MNKKEVEKISSKTYQNLLQKVSILLEDAREKTVKKINTIIVDTYWQIGKMIVKEEQAGKNKAEYGEKLIIRLSIDLTKKFGKGFSKSNLFMMRKFYLLYPPEKFQTLSGKSVESDFQLSLGSGLSIGRSDSSLEGGFSLDFSLGWGALFGGALLTETTTTNK